MELDDLKSIWKQPGFEPKGEAEIAAMLRGRSNSIISKIKRSVWFELIFTIAISIGLIVYAIKLPSGALKWTSVSILILCIVYAFYYVKKILLLNAYDATQVNIRQNLENLVNRLYAYLNFYRKSYAILYPIYFILGILFGVIENGPEKLEDKLTHWDTLLGFVAFTAIFLIVCYKFTAWYLKKLYGNHLQKLRGLLNELLDPIS